MKRAVITVAIWATTMMTMGLAQELTRAEPRNIYTATATVTETSHGWRFEVACIHEDGALRGDPPILMVTATATYLHETWHQHREQMNMRCQRSRSVYAERDFPVDQLDPRAITIEAVMQATDGIVMTPDGQLVGLGAVDVRVVGR